MKENKEGSQNNSDANDNASLNRFRSFVSAIVTDGDWEYGDGTPMTDDAKVALGYLDVAIGETQKFADIARAFYRTSAQEDQPSNHDAENAPREGDA